MKKAVLFLAAALSSHAAILTLTPSTLTPLAGSTFTVEVSLTNVFDQSPGDEIIGFGFNVTTTDMAIAMFQSAAVDPAFTDDSACCVGTIDVVGLTDFLNPITDPTVEPLTLAVLTFKALIAGSVSVGITSDPSDLIQGLQFLLEPDGETLAGAIDLRVIDAAAIPEPSSFALLAIGAVGLALRRR